MARPVRCSRFLWCGVCARIHSWYLAANFFLMFRLSSAWETSPFSGCPQWARCPVWDQMQGRAISLWQSQHTPLRHHCLRYRIGEACIVTSQHTPLWHHLLSTGLQGLALWRHSTYVCGIHFGEEILRGLGRQRLASICDITSCAVLGSFMVSGSQHLNVVLLLCKIAAYGGLRTLAMRRPS